MNALAYESEYVSMCLSVVVTLGAELLQLLVVPVQMLD